MTIKNCFLNASPQSQKLFIGFKEFLLYIIFRFTLHLNHNKIFKVKNRTDDL